jgi:hypothetical protein
MSQPSIPQNTVSPPDPEMFSTVVEFTDFARASTQREVPPIEVSSGNTRNAKFRL